MFRPEDDDTSSPLSYPSAPLLRSASDTSANFATAAQAFLPDDEDDAESRTSRDSLLTARERDCDNETLAPHAMREWIRMDSTAPDKIGAQIRSTETTASSSKDTQHEGASNIDAVPARADGTEAPSTTEYRVYKRRFFGLFQLVLLNVIVSWDVRCLIPLTDLISSAVREKLT